MLEILRPDLKEFNPIKVLTEAQVNYEVWKAGASTNSELASSIRAFQDILNGALHRARVATLEKGDPDFSWPKMADALAKKGSANKSLRIIQKTDDRLHLAFTEISKKTKEVDHDEMDRNYRDYIEHAYAVLSLIDDNLLK